MFNSKIPMSGRGIDTASGVARLVEQLRDQKRLALQQEQSQFNQRLGENRMALDQEAAARAQEAHESQLGLNQFNQRLGESRIALEQEAAARAQEAHESQIGMDQSKRGLLQTDAMFNVYRNFPAREQERIRSLAKMAPYIRKKIESGDIEGAKESLRNRLENIGRREAEGENIDPADTEALLALIESGDIDGALEVLTPFERLGSK